MPLFMDRHEAPGTSREETARNHAADLEVADSFGVDFFSYWHDTNDEVVVCFARADDIDAVTEVHRASHGQIPGEVIEVSESEVVKFLGRIHEPANADEITSSLRTICFTDLVGSTELLDTLGQAEFMVLLSEHDLITRKALVKWNGREVKHTGDGFMVAFDETTDALGWALELQDVFDEHDDLSVRVGIASGQPVDRDDDLFGAAVNLANRICSSAGSGQTHVSEQVHHAGQAGYSFGPRMEKSLKGFSEPVGLYQLTGEAEA